MATLQSLDLELEAVSPLWMGGAGRQAELRPPSVRGCLRYWFRALAGGLLQESLPEIFAAESAVFGSTKRASAVRVQLSGSPRINIPIADDLDLSSGLGYMCWSVFQQKRDAILPGERFGLRMTLRPHPFATVEVAGRKLEKTDCFDLAAAALWLFVRLGAVGARGRRCGGSVRAVAEPEGWPARLPPIVSRATNPAELAAELGAGIKRVRQAARWMARPPADPSSFDILHERVCQLYLPETTFATWHEAAGWAGEIFRAFRVEHKLDATAIALLLTQGRMAARTVVRALLGLPITFFFKSIHAELVAGGVDSRDARRKASASVGPAGGLGRASPVFFRIVRMDGEPERYGVLMGLFRSQLLPDDEMTLRPGDPSIRPVRLEVPKDLSIYDRWFDHVRQQGPLHAVALR